MGCFKFPKALSNRMTGLVINFWWEGAKKHKAIHWLQKDTILKERTQGGLGFRSFKSLNEAMLMKKLYRLPTNPDSMISMIMKNKYFRIHDISVCKPNSFVWKSIIGFMESFKVGLCLNDQHQWI